MNKPFQEKLLHVEVPPPPAVWETIAASLDGETSFEKRLQAYAETPPAQGWNRIEAALAQPAPVIPFFTRYKTPLRYIAAASALAVVLTVLTLVTRRTEAGPSAANSGRELSTPPAGGSTAALASPSKTNRPEPAVADNKPEADRGAIASIRRSLAFIRPQNILPRLSISRRFIPQQADEKPELSFPPLDKFMVYSDGDGNAMRLPKKLFGLVSCADGDGSCKERIRRLQQTMAANTGSADFAGMLDMLRTLQ